MRLAAYAGASTALAAGAILRAFSERPNFYSAAVYLAQSSACRMILANFTLLYFGFFMYGLQRLLFGHLRPIEIEQLWDRGWYTITETALAMTTFRDEVGIWFFIMFVSLLAGKVWGWISQGRVEVLEQQPPANPRMFHARLVTSLALSVLFDILFLQYCIQTLLDQPRPGMMVMFAFEFALLLISSTSTAARYGLSVQEILVVKKQTKERVEERRREIRASRAASEAEQTGEASAGTRSMEEEEVDENEIDVPGWQEKGRWVLFLDLVTDLLKLLVYIGFFFFLILFHGLPIHIIRDLYMTTTSFVRRIRDYVRYRNATRDMNQRYEDATAEDLERDGTCIVCREDMRPWQQPEVQAQAGQRQTQIDERHRPKKLPCGHILHLGCLRSWLERQQVCPTCRRSVMEPASGRSSTTPRDAPPAAGNGNAQPPQRPENPHDNANNARDGPQLRRRDRTNNNQNQPNNPNNHRNNNNNNNLRARTWNLGSMRITFAAGNRQEVQEALRHVPDAPNIEELEHAANQEASQAVTQAEGSLEGQIQGVQQRLFREMSQLQNAQEELHLLRAMQQELARLQARQDSSSASSATIVPDAQHTSGPPNGTTAEQVSSLHQQNNANQSSLNNLQRQSMQRLVQINSMQQQLQSMQQQYPYFVGNGRSNALPAGDPNLPAGVTIPEGWSLMPLQRLYAGNSSNTANFSPSSFDIVPQESPIANPQTGTAPSDHGAVGASNSQSASDGRTGTTGTDAPSASQPRLGALNTSGLPDINNQAGNGATDNTPLSRTSSPAAPTPIRQVNRQNSSSSLNLPNWTSSIPIATSRRRSGTPETPRSSSAAGVRGASTDTQSPATATQPQAAETEANGHLNSSDKGKARAATVEDDVDDRDDDAQS